MYLCYPLTIYYNKCVVIKSFSDYYELILEVISDSLNDKIPTSNVRFENPQNLL